VRGGVSAAVLALAVACGGCTGITAPDLFAVYRSGSVRGAEIVMVVNEEGGVRCNAGSTADRYARQFKLSESKLIAARDIQEALASPSSSHLTLRPRTGSTLSYLVRDETGWVRFSDNSSGQPKVLHQLALFVTEVAQQVCHLPL
jgi:hypothetical protein